MLFFAQAPLTTVLVVIKGHVNWNYTTHDDKQTYGRKHLGRRYRIIPLPPEYRYKKNYTLTKRLEKKLESNYTWMLQAILNKYWRQHPTKHVLYTHLKPLTKTIQVRRTRLAGQYWRSRDVLISDVLLWTPLHDRVKAGQPARTYIQHLCEDTGRSPGDLPDAMNDRGWWKERVRDIRADGTTRWWWYTHYERERAAHTNIIWNISWMYMEANLN